MHLGTENKIERLTVMLKVVGVSLQEPSILDHWKLHEPDHSGKIKRSGISSNATIRQYRPLLTYTEKRNSIVRLDTCYASDRLGAYNI